MGYVYVRFVWYLIVFIVVALLVLMKAIQWIKEYKNNQRTYDNDLAHQLEILKHKNSQNKQKGENNDNQS